MVRTQSSASGRTRIEGGSTEAQLSAPSLEVANLPAAVTRLRARILRAAASGAIDDLLIPIQWNEVPPLFTRGQPQSFDPIAFLKTRSFDGQGREMLRILDAVFRQPFATMIRGPTTTFVWPTFPVVAERQPSGRERLAPWRCVRFADLAARTRDGAPLIHRAAIGIDGTWHYFWTDV